MPLNWNFNLMDGVSSTASTMAGTLEFLAKKMAAAAGGVEDVEKAMRKMGDGASHATSSLAEFGLEMSAVKEIASAFIEVGRFAFDKVWDFEKKSVEALEFKENTLTSFETILGSAKEAQEFFDKAAWLGRSTPFKTQDVVGQFQKLLSSGFTTAEVPVVFQAVGDAAAQRGFSTDVMNNITNALGHAMASGGHNMGRVLQMLQFDAAGTGFQRGLFLKTLAKNLGVDKDGVETLLSSGQVDGRAFVKAFIDQMADTAGGGMTGGGMKKMENNFRGIMNTLEGTFSEFFFLKEGSADNVEGFVTLKKALMNVRDALNVTTPAGKALQTAVVDAFSHITQAVTGSLSGPDGMKTAEEIVRKTAVAFEDLGDIVVIGMGGAEAMVVAFLQGIGVLDDKADDLFSGPMSKEKLEEQKEAFKKFGKEVGDSFAHIVREVQALISVWEQVKPIGTWAEKTLNTVQPDKKEMSLWQWWAEGGPWRKPHHAAPWGTTMDKQPGGNPGAARAAVPPITVNINSGHADPVAVGAQAKAGVHAALQQHVDATHRVALQAGEQ